MLESTTQEKIHEECRTHKSLLREMARSINNHDENCDLRIWASLPISFLDWDTRDQFLRCPIPEFDCCLGPYCPGGEFDNDD